MTYYSDKQRFKKKTKKILDFLYNILDIISKIKYYINIRNKKH